MNGIYAINVWIRSSESFIYPECNGNFNQEVTKMKSEPRKINGMLRTIIKAINHYEKTGNHKQVVFRYKAENKILNS